VERGANVGGNVVVGIVVGVERAVDGGAALVQAGLAGDLDGDPAQHHPRDSYHCACYRSHRSLFGVVLMGFSFLLCPSLQICPLRNEVMGADKTKSLLSNFIIIIQILNVI
jgi:hypothetical protein